MTERISLTAMCFSHLSTFVLTVLSLASISSDVGTLRAEDSHDRLTRIAPTSIIADSSDAGRLLKAKLFVTPDEIARYLFLTNGSDGDRSVALYRAAGKEGSIPGGYWITTTAASASVLRCIPYEGQEEAPIKAQDVVVQRYDAPIPASTAQEVHRLWLAMLERSQPESEISISPTGILSATNAKGTHLRAATSWLEDNSISLAVMQLGQSLINYPKLSPDKRATLAREIEKRSHLLLRRVRSFARPASI